MYMYKEICWLFIALSFMIQEYAHDPDIGNNSLLTYYIEKPFRFSGGLQGI